MQRIKQEHYEEQAQYLNDLQEQLVENEQKKQEAYQEFLKDKLLVDEIVKKIYEQDQTWVRHLFLQSWTWPHRAHIESVFSSTDLSWFYWTFIAITAFADWLNRLSFVSIVIYCDWDFMITLECEGPFLLRHNIKTVVK